MATREQLSGLRPGSRVFVLYDAAEAFYHERLVLAKIEGCRLETRSVFKRYPPEALGRREARCGGTG
eukprot:2040-Lingulodinium_polyedra.AAC.1